MTDPTVAVLVARSRQQIHRAFEEYCNLHPHEDFDAGKCVRYIFRHATMAMDDNGGELDNRRFKRQMIRIGSAVMSILQLMGGFTDEDIQELVGVAAGPTPEQRGKQF